MLYKVWFLKQQLWFWKKSLNNLIVPGKPSQLVFTSPSLNHNLAHYNLTWRSDSFSPIVAYKLRFKVAKVNHLCCASNYPTLFPGWKQYKLNSLTRMVWGSGSRSIHRSIFFDLVLHIQLSKSRNCIWHQGTRYHHKFT